MHYDPYNDPPIVVDIFNFRFVHYGHKISMMLGAKRATLTRESKLKRGTDLGAMGRKKKAKN